MWQQVSGQINIRFPGFLWCCNPGLGGHWPQGIPERLFSWPFFSKSNYTYEYDYNEQKIITFKKQFVCALNHLTHIWDTIRPKSLIWWKYTSVKEFEGLNRAHEDSYGNMEPLNCMLCTAFTCCYWSNFVCKIPPSDIHYWLTACSQLFVPMSVCNKRVRRSLNLSYIDLNCTLQRLTIPGTYLFERATHYLPSDFTDPIKL